MTHICVGKLAIIGSDNGLSPGRRQAIFWTNAEILSIGPLGTNFSENFNRNSNIFIPENTFESVVCETAAILSRPQCVNIPGQLLCLWGSLYRKAYVCNLRPQASPWFQGLLASLPWILVALRGWWPNINRMQQGIHNPIPSASVAMAIDWFGPRGPQSQEEGPPCGGINLL